MKTSQGEVDIYPFRIAYQEQVRDFILCGLSENIAQYMTGSLS